MSYEVEKIWKDAVVGCKILFRQLPGGNDESNKTSVRTSGVPETGRDSNAVLPKHKSEATLPEPIRSVG
jgi:hypothetical protein